MNIEKIPTERGVIASVTSDTPVITDVQSALDLLMTVRYETGAERMAINKEAVAEEFFILRSGLAGEVLQKFVNYRMKLAVYGDYSVYSSKPLRDFIYESNKGSSVFFPDTRQRAMEMLAAV